MLVRGPFNARSPLSRAFRRTLLRSPSNEQRESIVLENISIYSVFSVEFEEARTRYTEGVSEVTEGFCLGRGTTLNGTVDVKI